MNTKISNGMQQFCLEEVNVIFLCQGEDKDEDEDDRHNNYQLFTQTV